MTLKSLLKQLTLHQQEINLHWVMFLTIAQYGLAYPDHNPSFTQQAD